MQRSLATRLQKLERTHKPEGGVFFMVWASDRAGVDAALDSAREAGRIRAGDIVIGEVWPTELEPLPASRWLVNNSGRAEMPDDEEDVLIEILQERIRKGETLPPLPRSATVGWGRKRVETDWSREELLAISMGRQLAD